MKILENLGNIGDFIGGIGVVATLVYLAIQIRQSTAALKATRRQEVTNGFRDWSRPGIDPRAQAAFVSGLHRYPDTETGCILGNTEFRDPVRHLTDNPPPNLERGWKSWQMLVILASYTPDNAS